MEQDNTDYIDCPKRILNGCVVVREWCDRKYCAPKNKKVK